MPPHTQQEKVFLKVDSTWYNARSFAEKHPGGAEILEFCHLEDITDQFYSVHSERAGKWLRALPKVSTQALEAEMQKHNKTEPKRSQTSLSFEKFRQQLEKEGWFERSVWGDLFYLGSLALLYTLGFYFGSMRATGPLTQYSWVLGSFLLGLGMQQAGWISHDYSHMREGKFLVVVSYVTGLLLNGFSVQWWSRKHNGLHHVFTNQMGIDPDINNEPVLFLSTPKEGDVWYRKYQHIYYHFVFSFLYVSWRIQSIQYIIEHKLLLEGSIIAMSYSILFYFLPLKVILCSILIGGWLVAEIVTATHQDEEFLTEKSFDFVADQFKTTRDVVLDSTFMNWLWGGMQYQLIHHLFPKMPKYYYPECSKKLLKWCEENQIEYKRSSAWEMFWRNYSVYKRNALAGSEIDGHVSSVKDLQSQLENTRNSMEEYIMIQRDEIKKSIEKRYTTGADSAKQFVDEKMEKVLKQIESSFSEFSVL
mmetsp:Transcript_9314/g.34460  ORF Transcript_9314/g.34460 Transcript_9314/m.34460 type:complete len:476 (-) Transcript_9314:139-1566(-)|eukprot:CAMPEP_0117449772 /NCGR_PEP_ID=MMETSP0759-20121206/8116_1 /TAXON_ID=63605 /ORGANISM="Percolomonas cosmopolitus, Strain WS" /LENGTH=475 /DNA_ID=CAMNT_0005242255 /DNA_START=84 /DNA_END=1511 /DNA_ORIENTATION=-